RSICQIWTSLNANVKTFTQVVSSGPFGGWPPIAAITRGRLSPIPVGIFLPPLPRAQDHRLQLGYLRSPAQLSHDLLRAGDQRWRIARPPRFFLAADFSASNVACGLDHLLYAMPAAVSQVVDQPLRLGFPSQLPQRKHVCARQVADVNIVADAG